MATTKLAIHVPPDANPINVTQLIIALAKEQGNYHTAKEIMEFAEAQGIGSRGEIQQIASVMNLLEKNADGLMLSTRGKVIAQMREDVQCDLLHFSLYTAWQPSKPFEALASWGYNQSVLQYWKSQSVKLDGLYLDRQVEEIINEARHFFSENMSNKGFDEIAFSRKSLNGVYKWLAALQPSVIENETFARRAFCSPQLLLLSIGYVFQDEPNITDYDILLTRDKRNAICEICLLEPDALDKALDWAIPIFPNIITSGTSAGFYGRFIRLHKRPEWEDIIR